MYKEAKHGKGEVFKVVKQMVKRNKDVTGARCFRKARGNVVMDHGRMACHV